MSFEHSIVCSDSWNNCLVVGTMNGVFVIDEALPWDIKPLFDKSVQLRQLDICELNGLMIMCDVKGHVSVFRLAEFSQIVADSSSWDSDQAKTKAHCKEHRLEIIPAACHTYAIGKQLIVTRNKSTGVQEPSSLRLLAACGRKLFLIEYSANSSTGASTSSLSNMVCNSCATATLNSSSIANSLVQNPIVGVTQLATGPGLPSSLSGQNLSGDADDVTKLFQIRREFICSDVPNLINLVNSFSGENYILVSYKNKCELLSERSGECLKQFQFNSMSNIRSIVELYDNHKLEILVTYNCMILSHFTKCSSKSIIYKHFVDKNRYL